MRNALAPMMLLASTMLLASCGQGPVLYVDDAHIRLPAVPGRPAAGYFTIHGGKQDVQLLDVLAPAAVRVEMHETKQADGMSSMAPIKSVDVPAKSEVKFAPGGKHLMVYTINPLALKNDKLSMTFIFSNGDRIIADADIEKANGDAATSDDVAKTKGAPAKADNGAGS